MCLRACVCVRVVAQSPPQRAWFHVAAHCQVDAPPAAQHDRAACQPGLPRPSQCRGPPPSRHHRSNRSRSNSAKACAILVIRNCGWCWNRLPAALKTPRLNQRTSPAHEIASCCCAAACCHCCLLLLLLVRFGEASRLSFVQVKLLYRAQLPLCRLVLCRLSVSAKQPAMQFPALLYIHRLIRPKYMVADVTLYASCMSCKKYLS